MWCSDWAEILCGNISTLEEHLLKISHNVHAWFRRCFKTEGGSWARHARSWDIWRAVALSKWTDGSFSCVVKTQKCRSNKIYKTELTKIRYKNQVLCKYRVDPQRAGLTLIA